MIACELIAALALFSYYIIIINYLLTRMGRAREEFVDTNVVVIDIFESTTNKQVTIT